MIGRTSAGLLSIALLWSTGCFITQNDKSIVTPAGGGAPAKPEEMPRTAAKKEDGPKRNPQPSTEVAYGRMKETEADAESARANPELQGRLRAEARKAYQQALKSDPTHLDAQRSLAHLYVKTGEFDRAREIYNKALAKHPRDAGLWYEFGLYHQRKKDLAESVRCFNKALEIDPENRDYLKKLGFTLAYQGNLEQGMALLTRAHGSALAHYFIARVLIQKNDLEQARQHLTIALRENAQLAEARQLLNSLEVPAAATTAPRGTSE